MPAAHRDTAATPATATPATATPAARVHGRAGRPAGRQAALLGLQHRYGNRRARSIIQAKLAVGPVGDRYEQEADRVSRQAMSGAASGAPERIQHVHSAAGGLADQAVEQAVARARGGGRPVPSGVRERMEQVSGADLGGVRLHVDAESDRLNDALESRAFTVGADVFVRRSEYRPGTAQGDALLGHELTHTVQQGASGGEFSAPAPAAPVAQRQGLGDRLLRLLRLRRGIDLNNMQVVGPAAGAAPTFTQSEGDERAARFGLPPMREKLQNIGGPGPAGDSVAVAHNVHFIWLGAKRSLEPQEKQNIKNWVALAGEAGWKVHLWMDGPAATKNEDFLDEVLGSLVLHDVEEFDLELGADALGDAIKRQAYTQASDILRLMALSEMGGIYLDVDMEPGEAVLPNDLMMDELGIPFLGPNLQNQEVLESRLNTPAYADLRRRYYREEPAPAKSATDRLKAPLRAGGRLFARLKRAIGPGRNQTAAPAQPGDMAAILADYAQLTLEEKVDFGNGFIVAAKDMPFLRLLLKRIVEFSGQEVAGENITMLAKKSVNNDTVDVTGYRLMQNEILRLLGADAVIRFSTWSAAVEQGLLGYDPAAVEQWKRMGWLTSASNVA